MAIERERKFLVIKDKLPSDFFTRTTGKQAIQTGYFTRGNVAIRVSRKNVGQPSEKCKVCFKGPGTEERQEFEYTIPNKDAEALIELAPTFLQKVRYDFEGWEIDCIDISKSPMNDHLQGKAAEGPHEIWVAEWEEHEGKAAIPSPLPEWIDREVTEEPRVYSNQALAWKHGTIGNW